VVHPPLLRRLVQRSGSKYVRLNMHRISDHLVLTRRGALTLAAGVSFSGWMRLYAANPDFWNKKEPADWSSEEIEQLITKSPWAKEISAQIPAQGGQSGNMGGGQGQGQGQGGGGWGGPRMGGTGIPGVGIPGIGGGGGGGMGGGGRQRGGGNGQAMQNIRGTIRWESAKPVLEALKTKLPDTLANHYVISMNGFPLNGSSRRRYEDDGDSRSASSTDDILDRFKGVTSLEPKGGRDAQPGVVLQQPSSSNESVLFGFSKDLLSLKSDDKEVTFTTQLGRVQIRAKFNLKEMLYRGELAL
jgi:hypothetical protein